MLSLNSNREKPKPELERTINTFIPCGNIPSGTCIPGIQYWMHNDSEANWIKLNRPSVYGPKDIIYNCNSLGYRSPEFNTRSNVNILSIGSSWTLGAAIAQKDIFTEIIKSRLEEALKTTITHWNMGQGGASNDWIGRMCCIAIPLLNPQLIIINFTIPYRREYIDITGKEIRYMPSHCAGFLNKQPYAYDLLHKLTSEHDNLINLYRNYKLAEAATSQREWIFSSITNDLELYLMPHTQKERYAGVFERFDYGRDLIHPGPQSHKKHADKIYAKIEALNIIEKLRH